MFSRHGRDEQPIGIEVRQRIKCGPPEGWETFFLKILENMHSERSYGKDIVMFRINLKFGPLMLKVLWRSGVILRL